MTTYFHRGTTPSFFSETFLRGRSGCAGSADWENEKLYKFLWLTYGIISVIVGGLSLYFGIFNSKEIGETIVVVLGIILAYAGVQNFVNLFFGKKN